MQRIEDQCVGCGLPCMGDRCPNRNVVVLSCDCCGEDILGSDDLYEVDGEELCVECLKDRFRKGI